MKKNENVVIKIEKGSIAEELGISVGDVLVAINDEEITDVFDYRYQINEEYLEMTFRTPEGEEYIAEIEKDFDEDIGIVFESGLMDQARSCRNKCIFCFIDQLPKGMRETLYFKDDDSRLSFLQGNYVTLTNMSEKDINHIIFYHLSPINISVHTTDLELRKTMLKNKNADKVIDIMKRLKDAGIEMNLQVVLCNGINDGDILDKTISDCAKFMPNAHSMSIVPIGLTKYRDGLYPMKPFSKEDSEKVISQVEKWQEKFYKEYGTRFVYCADEFYLKAERPLPNADIFEDFAQYENGVGMLSLFEKEFYEELEKISYNNQNKKVVSVATGVAAYDLIKKLSDKLMEKIPSLTVNVYSIKNDFFGEMITVSGLLTGQDIINQLRDKDLGEYLLLPESLLRNGTKTLLDDVEIDDIEKELNIKIKISTNSGDKFIKKILNTEE